MNFDVIFARYSVNVDLTVSIAHISSDNPNLLIVHPRSESKANEIDGCYCIRTSLIAEL
jgi:hypothetical protein